MASASKSAVISTPGDSGLSWLLLVAAIAALAVAGVVVLVVDRLQPESGPAITLPGWRPRRPRLSPLVAALTALPRSAREAMRRPRPYGGEASDEVAPALEPEPVATELVEPAPASAPADDARLAQAEAAFNLGGVRAECGDFDGAEALYRRADELGHAAGAFNLGVLLEHENDFVAAEAAYRRSDERGNALAAFNLGELLHNRGDLAGAEAAYGRADERGDAGGAYSLGNVLAERGDLAGAERAFHRADARGHAAGAFNLGVLLEDRGDLASAEAAYRRARERGHGEVADMARAALVELGYRG
jgi:tetratricopeptide (TPR) repeat protein